MTSYAEVACAWLGDRPWAFTAIACFMSVIVALCATTAPHARSQWRTGLGVAVGCAALVLGVASAWARCSEVGRWRILRMVTPVDERCTRSAWERDCWKHPEYAAAWLADATELVAREQGFFGGPWLPLDRDASCSYPFMASEELLRVSLECATTATRARLPCLLSPAESSRWFAVRRTKLDGAPGWIEVVGEPVGETVLFQDVFRSTTVVYTVSAVVVKRVEWRDAGGEWHEMLAVPRVYQAWQWNEFRVQSIARAETEHAEEVRCVGDVVVASTRLYEAQAFPFEWRGKIE